MAVRSAKDRQTAIATRRAAGLPRRGDRAAGHGKTPFGPKGGRNRGGRGKERGGDAAPRTDPAGEGAADETGQ